MRFQHYTPSYLRYLLQPQDWPKFNIGTEQTQIDRNINQYCENLNSETFTFADFSISKRKSNLVFRTTRLEDSICIRHISHTLRKHYRIVSEERKTIVGQIVRLLGSDVPLNIVRTDISRFFASIDFDHLLDKIEGDRALRSRDTVLLRSINDSLKAQGGTGVPWGLSVSSILAEIYMREVDEACRRVPSVYYYARYVDDIVIFSARSSDEAMSAISNGLKSLSPTLRLSPTKTKFISESGYPILKNTQIEYLGYRFERFQKNKKHCGVSVSIAKNKVDKIKFRISKVFQEALVNFDIDTIRDRLKLLTGNCSFYKSTHSVPIRIGIASNYPSIDDTRQLIDLDHYLHVEIQKFLASLNGNPVNIRRRLIRSLFKYSFQKGFNMKISHQIPRERIQRAYKIWRHGN